MRVIISPSDPETPIQIPYHLYITLHKSLISGVCCWKHYRRSAGAGMWMRLCFPMHSGGHTITWWGQTSHSLTNTSSLTQVWKMAMWQYLISSFNFCYEYIPWPLLQYQSLMYVVLCLADETPFDFPLTTFWGKNDRRIKKEMVEGWTRFTTGKFQISQIEGHHLWPLDRDAKRVWQEAIVKELADISK